MMNEICQFTWSRCYLYAGATEEGETEAVAVAVAVIVAVQLWPT